MTDNTKTYCSFCGADDTMRNKIIKTEGAAICDECVLLCCTMLINPKTERLEFTKLPEVTSND